MVAAQIVAEQIHALRLVVQPHAGGTKEGARTAAQGQLPYALPKQEQGSVVALVGGADKGAAQLQGIAAVAEKFRIIPEQRSGIEIFGAIAVGRVGPDQAGAVGPGQGLRLFIHQH